MFFAEATLFPPIGEVIWNTTFAPEGLRSATAAENARKRAAASLAVLDKALTGKRFLLGESFSAADVMMGYSLLAAQYVGVLAGEFRNLAPYMAGLTERPALQKALAL